MCGGAIISDFISTTGPRGQRLTNDYLWPDFKNSGSGTGKRVQKKPLRSKIVDVDDEFEADFQGFKDDSDVEDDDDYVDVKPFAFSASNKKPTFSRGKPYFCFYFFF